MGTHSPLHKRGAAPSFGPYLLWPNGWMYQDATWYDGRPRPEQHCVRCRPSSTPRGAVPPNFGPCLLWPNGWMDQDAIWYEGRPQPRPHYVTWGPSSTSQKGHSPPIFGPSLLCPNGRPSQLRLSSCFFVCGFRDYPSGFQRTLDISYRVRRFETRATDVVSVAAAGLRMSPNGRTAVPLMARNRRRRAIHRQSRDGSAAAERRRQTVASAARRRD